MVLVSEDDGEDDDGDDIGDDHYCDDDDYHDSENEHTSVLTYTTISARHPSYASILRIFFPRGKGLSVLDGQNTPGSFSRPLFPPS